MKTKNKQIGNGMGKEQWAGLKAIIVMIIHLIVITTLVYDFFGLRELGLEWVILVYFFLIVFLYSIFYNILDKLHKFLGCVKNVKRNLLRKERQRFIKHILKGG